MPIYWSLPPETLGNYRPISLCNTVYKLVTKIIVARLRPHLDKLVSPMQSAFIPGRKGVDNAIVVQELIHTISSKKGRVGFLAIKVDLEKAYDKIEWSFIREVLLNANLPKKLVDLILSCVSSVSTSILFNGGNVEAIHPSRGIRQGDPISPYLFIMCMEVLGYLIEEKCCDKSWTPVKAQKVARPSPTSSLLTTWFYLQKLIMSIAQQFGMSLMLFVLDQANPLVTANPEFSFPRT